MSAAGWGIRSKTADVQDAVSTLDLIPLDRSERPTCGAAVMHDMNRPYETWNIPARPSDGTHLIGPVFKIDQYCLGWKNVDSKRAWWVRALRWLML